MNYQKHLISALFLTLIFTIPLTSYSAANADENIAKHATDDDYYAAGETIDIDFDVAGDVIVAGGKLFIGSRIEGDVMAAGGSVKVRGEVKDDVRITGGDLNIDAIVGDDLAASGGSITVSPNTTVRGEAWLAGGDVIMAGTINKDLKIMAGNIRLSGTVLGDVELEGGEIQVLEGARIDGNLLYKSSEEASIDPGVSITGTVTYEELEWDYSENGFGILFSLTLIAAGALLFWLFPKFTVSSAERINTDPWKSLGIGAALLIATPIVVVILMSIVLGAWIGLSVLALYFVALLLGFLIACFFVGGRGARMLKKDISTTGRRIASVALVIILIGFLSIIPVLGGLMLFALLLFGLGAGILQLHFVYRHTEPNVPITPESIQKDSSYRIPDRARHRL
jgi:cytoskeletal protein CcmA (bactofilin family)